MYQTKPTLLADASVIAGYDNDFPPKMEYYKLMFYTLKTKYYVIGIADWGLYGVIDDFESYKYFLSRRFIIQSPPGIKADILLIMKARQDDCLILTLDRFLDHMDIIPSKPWLKSHRATFEINDGEFKINLPR